MSVRALLFDVDGTIADTEETHREAFNAAFREHHLPHVWEPDEYRDLLAVTGGRERLAHYFESARVAWSHGLVADVHRTKTMKYGELVASGSVPLRPGVARLWDEAREAGLRLGITTTTTEANVHALLEAALGTGAASRFAVLACGDVVPAKKPAPDVYLHALAVLGLAPHEAVAFEDSTPGLASAKAAGLFTVVTPCQWTERQDLSAADVRVSHLGDPAAPLSGEDAVRAGGPTLTLERILREKRARGA
jgi:HAD superfamily hydrolase (TIGR01509 family)